MKIKTTIEKLNEALATIQEKGGKVRVEGSNGSFAIMGVEGRFSFDQDADVLTIVIDDKPWLASDSMIESEIRKFFA